MGGSEGHHVEHPWSVKLRAIRAKDISDQLPCAAALWLGVKQQYRFAHQIKENELSGWIKYCKLGFDGVHHHHHMEGKPSRSNGTAKGQVAEPSAPP